MSGSSSPARSPAPPFARVAVSDCLRGTPVRWDGTDNADCWPLATMARLFTLVGLCPEASMGVPRPPIQLVGAAASPRAVSVAAPRHDHTDALAGYAQRMAPTLSGVSGYIFADRSPSCGLSGVKVFRDDGGYARVGRGVYAAAVLAARPGLPAVDAETLRDESALLDFAVAVVAYGTPGADQLRLRDIVERALRVSVSAGPA